MKQFRCMLDQETEDCGLIETFQFDGYDVGERILEGIMFEAWFDESGELSTDSVEDWAEDPYLIGLDRDHWITRAKDHAESCIKDGEAICPKCGEVTIIQVHY